jgi:flagellar basal-body rod protein FlgF
MIRGLYTSGWSMLANTKKMDVISNNLANASTTAFKKDTVVFEAFPEILTRRLNDVQSNSNPSGRIGSMELSSDVGEVFTYYNQGQLVKTGSDFDIAINGANTAFFTVLVPGQDGTVNEYFTRDGAFTLNSDNQLVTKEGYPVMGEQGGIYLDDGPFTVEDDGTLVQNGIVVDRLLIRQFANGSDLRKYGSNLVESTEGAQQINFTGVIEQGNIEQSNVDIVREMVDMISVVRAYEANQKMIQVQDETLGKAVNEVGVVG